MNPSSSYRLFIPTVTLQRIVINPSILTSEQQILLASSPELQAEARLQRQLYWKARQEHPSHPAHADAGLESRLNDLLSGGLPLDEADALWEQIEQCSVCRSLAEEAYLDLTAYKTPLSTRATEFLAQREQHWQERLELELRHREPLAVAEPGPALQEIVSTVGEETLDVPKPAEAVRSASPTPEPSTGGGWWTRLETSWQALSAGLRWSMSGGALVSALVLLVLLKNGSGIPGSTEPRTFPDDWAARTDVQGFNGSVDLSGQQTKGGSASQGQALVVSLEGDLLMAGPDGQREVVAPLSAVTRPRAQAPNTAELRLRATLKGKGYLTLWQSSTSGTARLYDWPLAQYRQENAPILDREGDRLGITLPGETGSHVFILTLSEKPLPAKPDLAWLENLQSGQMKNIAVSRVIWDIR